VMAEVGRVVFAARLLEGAIAASAAEHGLSVPEGDILFTLRRSGDPRLSPSQLSHWLFVTSGTMTGRLDRLERRGLIRRVPNPDDRRGMDVELTPEGRQLADELVTAHVENEERMMSVLTRDERRTLQRIMRKLLAQLQPTPWMKRARGGYMSGSSSAGSGSSGGSMSAGSGASGGSTAAGVATSSGGSGGSDGTGGGSPSGGGARGAGGAPDPGAPRGDGGPPAQGADSFRGAGVGDCAAGACSAAVRCGRAVPSPVEIDDGCGLPLTAWPRRVATPGRRSAPLPRCRRAAMVGWVLACAPCRTSRGARRSIRSTMLGGCDSGTTRSKSSGRAAVSAPSENATSFTRVPLSLTGPDEEVRGVPAARDPTASSAPQPMIR
jgi:DNA-binding MarR family transcriptional regulator